MFNAGWEELFCLFGGVFLGFDEDEEFAEDVVEDDDDDLGDEFDNFVVEVEECHKDEHDGHIDEEREEAAHDEFDKFGEDVVVFDFEDEAAVGEIGEEYGDDPGDDVGGLELDGVLGVEDGEREGVVSAEADEGGEDADDEIANNLGIFGVFGAEEVAKFCEGHFADSSAAGWSSPCRWAWWRYGEM